MHELPVTEKILSTALRHALAAGAEKILTVRIEVGALSDFEETWIQRYFDALAAGSIAEGARIAVERISASGRCGSCGTVFGIEIGNREKHVCVSCGDTRWTLVSGDEFRVKNLEVEQCTLSM